MVVAIKPTPWAKRASLLLHLAQFCPTWPNLGPFCHSSNLTVVITFRNVLWVKVSGFYFSKLASWARFGPDLAKVWPRFGPNYVHLNHFVTGVGSSNLNNALTVVLTFRNLLWVEVLGFYFKNWLFRPDLAQIWPNLVHLKACKGWHYVSGAFELPMTLKKCSDSKSKVSKVKNSRDFFTLFSPQ